MLYKRSGIDHSLQGPGFIWGDPQSNGFVFHKDFEFEKVNRVQSLILRNLNTFEVDPFERIPNNFYEKTLLYNYVYRIQFYIEEKIMI